MKNAVLSGRGVYAILDVDAWRARGVEIAADGVAESIVRALIAGGASTLQLRAKDEPARVVLDVSRRLFALAREARVPFVTNDRVDLALLLRADAVHVGQDDLPLEDVRRIAPHLDVGLSTHDPSQLDAALAARPTYVAFGPVFGTTSKRAPDPIVGLDRLRDAARAANRAGVPLVAIGGVTTERAPSLVACGVRWAATIGELVAIDARGRPDVEGIVARTRALAAALEGRA